MTHLTRRLFVSGAAAAAAPWPQAVAQTGAGRNLLTSAWSGARVLPEPGRFHPFATAAERPEWEAIPIDDPRLRAVWRERLYRILLRAENPPPQATWTTCLASV